MNVTETISDFWRKQFPDRVELVALPFAGSRPPASSYLRESVTETLPVRVGPALALAAFESLLYRYTGQELIVVGALTPEVGTLVPVPSHWSGELDTPLPARALLRDAWLREAAAKTNLSLRTLQNQIGVEDSGTGPRLFNTAFVWSENCEPGWPMQDPDLGEFLAKCDMVVIVSPVASGLALTGDFDADILDATAVARLLGHLRTLIAAAAAEPHRAVLQLPILPASERDKILVEFNRTERAFPESTSLHALIEAQVERTPTATALTFEGRPVDYRELDERANQLAHLLIQNGVGPDVLVAICMERSLEMVVGLLGILKAGGAYVPVDPTYPRDRLAYMLEDAGTVVLLTQEHLLPQLPSHHAEVICLDACWNAIATQSRLRPPSQTSPDHLAYMIYTSGSTGRPKGALNTHRGIVNRLLWMQDEYSLTTADTVLQKTPFSFDVSVWEFFWPLLTGARLVVARPEGHKDPDYLVELITKERVTVLHFVPSMLRAFLEADNLEQCRSLREVICSGEALPPDLVPAFYSKLGARLHNLYGPTEAAVDVTYWECPRDRAVDVVPIGRPVANTQCHILDERLQPVPIGVAGELHLGGVQIGRGYHNRPELTAQKFIPNPFRADLSARLYKTGDLCRYFPDGNIEYLGRIDHQVKIRGFRVELGEIEAAISSLPSIHQVVVTAHEDAPGDRRLIAYVQLRPGAAADEATWRRHVKAVLPEFMAPADFVVLDALPISPNGKVDRKALPKPAALRLGATAEGLPPANELEQRIATVWCEMLNLPQVGRQTNFFDAGGDSLKLVRMRQRLREQWRIEVPVVVLFQHPTIAALADFLARATDGDGGPGTTGAIQDRAHRQREAARRMQKNGSVRFTR